MRSSVRRAQQIAWNRVQAASGERLSLANGERQCVAAANAHVGKELPFVRDHSRTASMKSAMLSVGMGCAARATAMHCGISFFRSSSMPWTTNGVIADRLLTKAALTFVAAQPCAAKPVVG
jgi:hypothetical protein